MIPSETTKTENEKWQDRAIEHGYHKALSNQEECGKRLGERYSEWLVNFHLRFGADVTR